MSISTRDMLGKIRKATETIRRVILGSKLPGYHKRDLADAMAAGEDVAAALEADADRATLPEFGLTLRRGPVSLLSGRIVVDVADGGLDGAARVLAQTEIQANGTPGDIRVWVNLNPSPDDAKLNALAVATPPCGGTEGIVTGIDRPGVYLAYPAHGKPMVCEAFRVTSGLDGEPALMARAVGYESAWNVAGFMAMHRPEKLERLLSLTGAAPELAGPGQAGGWGDGAVTRTLNPGYYDRISGTRGDERDQT